MGTAGNRHKKRRSTWKAYHVDKRKAEDIDSLLDYLKRERERVGSGQSVESAQVIEPIAENKPDTTIHAHHIVFEFNQIRCEKESSQRKSQIPEAVRGSYRPEIF